MTDPRYPIGAFESLGRPLREDEREERIVTLAGHPRRVASLVEGARERLDTPYREGGWTARQLVHHLADSHLNAYTRFRLALTEDHPTIRPYDQDAWADLDDARHGDVTPSLAILEGVHARWTALLHANAPGDFQRTLRHPEIGDITLDWLLEQYAWHARHHEAHLAGVLEG